MATEWGLIYNGDAGFQEVAAGEFGEYSVENKVLFSLFQSILKSHE
jgi:hypothetical protein